MTAQTDSTASAQAMYDGIRASLRVSVVAKVEAWTADPPTVDCTPLVLEEPAGLTDEGKRPAPFGSITLLGVPLILPLGADRGLTFGLKAGDLVTLLVRHRSHDEVDDGSTTPAAPASLRRLDFSDAVAIPGFTAPGGTALGSAKARSDGAPVLFMAGSDIFYIGDGNAAIKLARADLVESWMDAVKNYIAALTLPVAGAVAGPPLPAPPFPTTPDTGSADVRVTG